MGYESLSAKLTADTGRPVSQSEAKTLMRMHRRIYSKYWEWVERIDNAVNRGAPMFSRDGWAIRTVKDHKYRNSLRNFLVQSNGAAVLRLATLLALRKNLQVISPLHDAIYIEHAEGDMQSIETLKECMSKSVTYLFPGLDIRLDVESHNSQQEWIEDKAKNTYTILKPFFTRDPHVKLKQWIMPELQPGMLFEELCKQ
jgi:DNA polymerase-1